MSDYIIFPLGDAAVTIDLGPVIDESVNRKVMAMQAHLSLHPFPGLLDVVVAYSSLTVYYNIYTIKKMTVAGTVFDRVRQELIQSWEKTNAAPVKMGRIIEIPVCYEGPFGPDLATVASLTRLSPETVIEKHTAQLYQVYMIGFLPGFPYLATTDAQLEVPRKDKPVPVNTGSVGLAGRQTGIYPLDSPGGWQIIGRTPVQLFDPADTIPSTLQPGDRVRFYSVTATAFNDIYHNRRFL